ncbi:hypothetical protein ACQJBY_027459 [Aegilops geniculata]
MRATPRATSSQGRSPAPDSLSVAPPSVGPLFLSFACAPARASPPDPAGRRPASSSPATVAAPGPPCASSSASASHGHERHQQPTSPPVAINPSTYVGAPLHLRPRPWPPRPDSWANRRRRRFLCLTRRRSSFDAKYQAERMPSSMTTRTTKFAYRRQDREYLFRTPGTPSCRQDPQIGPRTIDVSWTVYNYRRLEHLRKCVQLPP